MAAISRRDAGIVLIGQDRAKAVAAWQRRNVRNEDRHCGEDRDCGAMGGALLYYSPRGVVVYNEVLVRLLPLELVRCLRAKVPSHTVTPTAYVNR